MGEKKAGEKGDVGVERFGTGRGWENSDRPKENGSCCFFGRFGGYGGRFRAGLFHYGSRLIDR